MHISETCHDLPAPEETAPGTQPGNNAPATPPNVITNVATTDATVPDVKQVEPIHAALGRRALVPAEHYVDSGYAAADLIVAARRRYGLALVTPVLGDHSPQARAKTGFDRSAFTVDWDNQQVTCPQGQTSSSWSPCIQRGQEAIVVTFGGEVCHACPARSACTSAKKGGGQLTLRTRALQEVLDQGRREQHSTDWQARYAIRAGVEGTIHQGSRSPASARPATAASRRSTSNTSTPPSRSTSSAWTPGGTATCSIGPAPAISPASNSR
ncbi:transposase [Nonomuraea sp. NPDC050643]|uniref:transposase n=1 Tax=Nonomuraea sp. NPDC050643 TaxID=3155660 RepID=UPI0033D4B386